MGSLRVGNNWATFTSLHFTSLHTCTHTTAAAAAKSLQSCPTLCDPRDGSPPGSPVPGILQARTLEWVAISFSNAGSEKWKWSHSVVSDPQRPHELQPTRLLCPWELPGKITGVGCHCLLRNKEQTSLITGFGPLQSLAHLGVRNYLETDFLTLPVQMKLTIYRGEKVQPSRTQFFVQL